MVKVFTSKHNRIKTKQTRLGEGSESLSHKVIFYCNNEQGILTYSNRLVCPVNNFGTKIDSLIRKITNMVKIIQSGQKHTSFREDGS